MDVKDAIAAAKAYVQQVYDAEAITNLSLEEVAFDRSSQNWLITIGFSRPDNDSFRTRARELLEASSGYVPRRRVQKVVSISDYDGAAVAMKNREAA